MRQLRIPACKGIRPPRPTVRSEHVARAIAMRIVREVNLDEFYWAESEVDDRVYDVQREIMRAGRPHTVFTRLWRLQAPINCKGERGTRPYGWDGIDDHCRYIAEDIASEELEKATADWERRYRD